MYLSQKVRYESALFWGSPSSARLALSIANCAIVETDFQVTKETKWTQLEPGFNIRGMRMRQNGKHVNL